MAICGLAERVAPRPRTLTEAELNRALLARQLLLDRSRLSLTERAGADRWNPGPVRARDVRRAVEPDRGLRARAADPGARAPHRGPGDLAARHDPPPDAARLVGVLGRDRRAPPPRVGADTQAGDPRPDGRQPSQRVRPLFDDGPVERKVLQETIGLGAPGVSGINAWLDLVRVPPSGTWDRRRADLFADAADWIGPAPSSNPPRRPPSWSRSYLRGFGPGSAAEIADWAGLGLVEVRTALELLELRRFRAEDGEELVDLPRLPLPDPRDAGSGPLPADLGRDAAGPRSPVADPPGATPAEGVQHEDAAVGRDLPRERPGRGHLALREGPGGDRAVRAARQIGADRRRRGGGTPRRLSRLSGGLGSARCPR